MNEIGWQKVADPILSAEALKAFQRLIFELAGITLNDSKHALVAGRLGKRVRDLNLPDYMAYFRYITKGDGQHTGELQTCIDLLTTNETYFFREIKHFEFLQQHILPKHNLAKPLRIWSAASSSGEEAYSVAMVLADRLGLSAPWEIFASDICGRVLAKAVEAIYPEERLSHMPPGYRQRFLMKGTNAHAGYVRVVPELCQRVKFEHYNLISSPHPGKQFDVIFCRNVLIYFNELTKQQVVSRLCDALVDDGFLFVGHSESLHGTIPDLHAVSPSIYQKRRK